MALKRYRVSSVRRGDLGDVHRGFADSGCRNRSGLLTPRRGTACLAVFAIFFQAMLFGWHSHPLPVSPKGLPTALSASPTTGHEVPVPDDDDCQICFALSHHSAGPVDFIPPLLPGVASSPATRVEASLAPVGRFPHFRSRAPPRT